MSEERGFNPWNRDWVKPEEACGVLDQQKGIYKLTFSGYLGMEKASSRKEVWVTDGVTVVLGENSFVVFEINIYVRGVDKLELPKILESKIKEAISVLRGGKVSIRVEERRWLRRKWVDRIARDEYNLFFLVEAIEFLINQGELGNNFDSLYLDIPEPD